MTMRRNKLYEKQMKCTLRELPYSSYRGDFATSHGRFDNSISCATKSKRNLENFTSLYDLDLFSFNADYNVNNPESSAYIRSKFYSPHTCEQLKNSLTKNELEHTFSVFHNNVRSIRSNLEYLESHLLDELDFHFNIIGITETKITNSNSDVVLPKIPGYNFEYVPTPLSAGGVRMFIDEPLSYVVLEKKSSTAFQALWIEIGVPGKKSIVCGIIYRQHNSLKEFELYFDSEIENFISSGKTVCLLGDTNIDLLKSTRCQYAHDFLVSLKLLPHSHY